MSRGVRDFPKWLWEIPLRMAGASRSGPIGRAWPLETGELGELRAAEYLTSKKLSPRLSST